MKMKVGITGQAGFVGTHLFNFLKYSRKDVEVIPFEDAYFNNTPMLDQFVQQCDAIVHLAAMNRHGDPQVIYDTNIRLVSDLISSIEKQNLRPHLLFSSSTQEERDNPYGRSKKIGKRLFEEWAERNGARFTALIIPNVFGPFGKPHYNSAISTFSYQLTHNIEPTIEIDANLKLIYINDLVKRLSDNIDESGPTIRSINVEHITELKVSDILKQLVEFKERYMLNSIIPDLKGYVDIALFNTFRSYLESDHYPVYLNLHSDTRGYLFELLKAQTGGQVFFSSTEPGITRGNHFHTRKIERFCVVRGDALIKLRKIGSEQTIEYRVSGHKPSFIDMPVFYTHNITNVGQDELETLFWSNEIFSPEDSDTYYEIV